jgi:hypothetical protein
MKTNDAGPCELDDLVLPRCLLEASELDGTCDLEIQCVPGAIIIAAGDMPDGVPKPLAALFRELGVSGTAVRSVLTEGGLQNV